MELPPVTDPGTKDRERVERVACGDMDAFEELVRTHEPRLLAFLCRVTGDADVAGEVAQATLVKAYFKAHVFDRRCSFFTWLCEIGIRKFLDFRKQRDRWLRKHQIGDLGSAAGQPDRALGPPEQAARRELEEFVRMGIGRLPPKLQTVIVLREFQGASYEEIAAALGCTVGTVESRLFRARQKLRTILAPRIQSHDL